jgi:hypothetical protein
MQANPPSIAVARKQESWTAPERREGEIKPIEKTCFALRFEAVSTLTKMAILW